jgi:4-hydroxybenzoate polyprenyltransferase
MTRALRTALRLGRVSNLPTVWTDVMAGLALNGGTPRPGLVIPLALATSLFYVAGMFLNDAFDHRWDAQHRPDRPIPSGEVSAATVFKAGFGLMAAGLLLLALGPGSPRPVVGGLALGACILIYDVTHKANPFAAVVMGLCRVCVYVIAGWAVAPQLSGGTWAGAVVLLAYLVALTLIARHEHRNPRLPALVGLLIAGICLLDAGMLLVTGHVLAAALAVGAFYLTRRFQRCIAGT